MMLPPTTSPPRKHRFCSRPAHPQYYAGAADKLAALEAVVQN